MKSAKNLNHPAFTLVEIIMATIIIGLLAALVLPHFSTSRAQAKVNVTKANLEIIRAAIELYYENEHEWPDIALVKLWDGTSPSGKVYLKEIPKEAITNSNQVWGSYNNNGGWCHYLGGGFYPNVFGEDAFGESYYNY